MNRKTIKILVSILIIYSCIGYNGYVFSNNIAKKTTQTLLANDKLRLEDFTIGGLYLEQPISEVINFLGKPTKVLPMPNKDGFHEFDEEVYYFPDIIAKVYKIEQKVTQLQIRDKSVKTFREIKIGDKKEDVYYHYGKIVQADKNVLMYQFVAYQKYEKTHYVDTYYIITFFISNGRVARIDLDSVPSE